MTVPASLPAWMHRSPLDDQLLAQWAADAALITANHGRHLRVAADGCVWSALAFAGAAAQVVVYRDRQIVAQHATASPPSPPCLDERYHCWYSVGDTLYCDGREAGRGSLLDVTQDVLAVTVDGALELRRIGGASVSLSEGAGRASLAVDGRVVHVVFEQAMGLEYREISLEALAVQARGRIAEAFARDPVVLAHEGDLLVAYLGESLPPPPGDEAHWRGRPFRRRIGLGGYIATLVRRQGAWRAFTVAQSRPFAKPRWPRTATFAYDYPNVELPPRLDEFGPPALSVGPDGVPQVLWCNAARRWVFGARFLGDTFTAPAEVRGPLETLGRGAVLAPRQCVPGSGRLPLAFATSRRIYLDALILPTPDVMGGRTIDFVQLDELSQCAGLEVCANPMRRSEHNPLTRDPAPGSYASLCATFTVHHDGQWHATVKSKDRAASPWRNEQPARSDDGIHWHRPGPLPTDAAIHIDGVAHSADRISITWIRDDSEPQAERRFKGLWLTGKPGWGAWQTIVSPDARNWSQVDAGGLTIMCDEDLLIWRDEADVPARRFKASGNARSSCGRVLAQWTSADAVRWQDHAPALDPDQPLDAPPYFADDVAAGTVGGRVLVDPWAGPDDEEEIHGGYVFRDGDRWLCHYMKWGPDGRILPALASSREGLHFTRVAGGAATIPWSGPGQWDAGRLTIRNPPHLVNGLWWQHYSGSAWRHGMGGSGRRPHAGGTAGLVAFGPILPGLAQIEAGRWTCLRLTRDAEEGRFTTVPLRLSRPHTLSLDCDGVAAPGDLECVAVYDDERRVSVTVPQQEQTILPAGTLRLRVCIRRTQVRLYHLRLTPQR
jgi:hypothetical protein